MARQYTTPEELRRTARLLESHEFLLNEIERLANIGHWEWDISDNTLYWSDEIYRIFGINKSKFLAIYDDFLNHVHPDDKDAVENAVENSLKSNERYNIVHRIIRPDGEVRWVEENGEALFDGSGAPERMIGTVKDITKERHYSIQAERYSRILQSSFEEIYIFNANTYLFTQVSEGVLNNLGYTEEEMFKMTPYGIKTNYDLASFDKMVQPLKNGDLDIIKFEATHKRKDGSTYCCDIRLQYSGGEDPSFIALVTDISERKQYEEELKTQAFRDPGTNLYNKRFFQEQLEVSVNRAERDHAEFGLILIDLDDFSTVNNKYGHIAGDMLIKEIASRIDSVFSRRGDISARYGGDEFTILCYNMGPEMMGYKCQQLVDEISKEFNYEDTYIPHSASVGLCYYDGKEETTCKRLLECADKAMYAAKQAGKNQYKAYHEIK